MGLLSLKDSSSIEVLVLVQKAGLGPLAREQLTEQQLETVIDDIQFHPLKVSTPCSTEGMTQHSVRCINESLLAHARDQSAAVPEACKC